MEEEKSKRKRFQYSQEKHICPVSVFLLNVLIEAWDNNKKVKYCNPREAG